VPPVHLAELPREIRRALVGTERQVLGPYLPEVVFQDGDAACIALPAQVLEDDRGRCRGILLQEALDGLLVG